MSEPFAKESTRKAMEALPEIDPDNTSPSANVAYTYVPPSHARALDPESTLVEGIRGAGKSFWWMTLVSEPHRQYIASAFPEARISENIVITQGFGTGKSSAPGQFPSPDTLVQLSEKYPPRHIWRAVVAVHLEFSDPFPIGGKWREKVQWINDNPEEYDELLYRADSALTDAGKVHLIIFDALDRLAGDWPGIRPLAKALLQVALDLRSFRSIRAKLFVRPDMLEDREITQFPDSSKLLARKVPLSWRRVDLYALLFQCLGNAPSGGDNFREHCERVFQLVWKHDQASEAWIIPQPLRTEEEIQKKVFHAIAGPTMASGLSGHKRGFPYTWLVNHLMDGREQVSPRSFSAALRYAAKRENPEEWLYPLHYKAIQSGVQEASRIRVEEITRDDYPWVDSLMQPLKGRITVPCDAEEILNLWRQADIVNKLASLAGEAEKVKLPPQHLAEGPEGVLQDITELGLVQRLRNGRIQMPDVYRIAFGLGRRGGVKPLK